MKSDWYEWWTAVVMAVITWIYFCYIWSFQQTNSPRNLPQDPAMSPSTHDDEAGEPMDGVPEEKEMVCLIFMN